jgi:hypothetical protein
LKKQVKIVKSVTKQACGVIMSKKKQIIVQSG